MVRRLASIRLTFVCILSLGALLMTGVFLYNSPDGRDVIESLNGMLLFSWIGQHLFTHTTLSFWVFGVCTVAGLLFINTLCCTFFNLLPLALKRSNLKRWSFFGIHILFIVVLSCHGIALISGHKAENITLFPGASHPLTDGLTLQISEITYVDDIAILTKKKQESRKMMTRKRFHHHKNGVGADLMRGDDVVASGTVRFLEPLVYGSLRVTLTRFLLKKNQKRGETQGERGDALILNGAKGDKNIDQSTGAIGAVFTVTQNPFTSVFFTAYGLLIIAITGFIVATYQE